MIDYKNKAKSLERQVGLQQHKIRELEVANSNHMKLLKDIKFLLTSMQENWREQELFDIYDLIEKELKHD
jgi:hypothetical protein